MFFLLLVLNIFMKICTNSSLKAILPKPGDASPHLRELWLELTTLESIIHLLETGDNPEYNKAFYHQQHSVSVDEGGDTNNSPVVEGIKSLLKIPSTPCWGTKEEGTVASKPIELLKYKLLTMGSLFILC